jgi:hypothetical protein
MQRKGNEPDYFVCFLKNVLVTLKFNFYILAQ